MKVDHRKKCNLQKQNIRHYDNSQNGGSYLDKTGHGSTHTKASRHTRRECGWKFCIAVDDPNALNSCCNYYVCGELFQAVDIFIYVTIQSENIKLFFLKEQGLPKIFSLLHVNHSMHYSFIF